MPRFKFRLQSLLRLREQARERAQLAVAEALRRIDEIRELETDIHDELKDLERHMRSAANKGNLDVDRLLEGHRHQTSLRARLAQLDQAMDAASDEVRRCREQLVEADRQVKVLEKLHENELARHRRVLAQQENKQNDETATLRAARKDTC